MPTFVVPYRLNGKSRLADPDVARAMLRDVRAACEVLGETLVCDLPGGQGEAVAASLAHVRGPVAVVNADVPCVTAEELRLLVAAAPALVAAPDGTTNALALVDAADFLPLYGPGSAERFADRLRATPLDLPGLRDDVDTGDDLLRVADRAGRFTREALGARV